MPIINKLYELYEGAGFTVTSGLNPYHHQGYLGAPFTWLMKDGKSFSNGLGIALQEIYFLECLFSEFRPETALIIGNSFGWSSLAVGLLNPDARIVAVDACFDENSDIGLDLTNSLAVKAGIDVTAMKGVSPKDVPRIVDEVLDGRISFCFVDGLHTNEQVFKDYAAVKPFMDENGLILFHDVVSCDLIDGITRIGQDMGRDLELLYATSSGMAFLCMGDDVAFQRTMKTFKGDADAIDLMRQNHRYSKHRHLNRWRRSIEKRLKFLKTMRP